MSATPADELRALRGGAGLHQPRDVAFLRVQGADAADYLQRMTSQDLSGLESGMVRRSCVLNAKGRLLGAPWVWRFADGFLLELARGAVPATQAQLERYIIADDVRISSAHGGVFLLAGPDSEAVSGVVAQGDGLYVARRDLGDVMGYAWLVLADGPEEKVVFAATHQSVSPAGDAAWDALRVLTRTAAWGPELSDEILPLEARLERNAISFAKGCYPGQEPVTMAVHRGHPPSLLVRVRIEGGGPGRALLDGDRPAGRLTTTTALTEPDEANALAFVRYGLAGEAPALEIEGGGTARVLEGEGP